MSNNKIKTGKEILDNFFSTIHEIDNVQSEMTDLIKSLYDEDKLTDSNLKNGLSDLRKSSKDEN